MKAQHLCAVSFITSTLLPSREPAWSEALTEGKAPRGQLRLRLQFCDFPQLRTSHLPSSVQILWCWTRHEAHAASPHCKHYLFSSLIAGCLFSWSLKELNTLWPLLLCQIRVKLASRFICYSHGLRHTGILENQAKATPTDTLLLHGCKTCGHKATYWVKLGPGENSLGIQQSQDFTQ